jgi:flagellar motility protein MotE (MotC chaperone)
MPTLRLIPIVLFATICLLAIKTVGFIGSGAPAQAERSLSGDVWRLVAGKQHVDADRLITGATPEAKAAPTTPPPIAALPKSQQPGMVKADATKGNSPSERALIERLQERRQELEARERDLEMRENLIKAAEKQLDGRIEELKGLEGKGGDAPARIKNIVVMYESMGPKEAARVFDRMDAKTLVELVNQMNPRKVSEILAKMQPEAAERLTVEMARRKPASDQALPATDLRRIDAKAGR